MAVTFVPVERQHSKQHRRRCSEDGFLIRGSHSEMQKREVEKERDGDIEEEKK